MISKRMQFDDDIYGVFSVSVRNDLLDEHAKEMFSDLVDDVSTAIYALRLNETKEAFKKELIESRNMYRRLLETSSIPMAILNLDGRIVFASNSLYDMLGIDRTLDLQKESLYGFDFLNKEFIKTGKKRLKEVLERDTISIYDYIFKSLDGRQYHVRLRTSLIRNLDGAPSGFMVVFNDLSSEVKTAEELRMSEEQFRLLFMKAPNGVALLSATGVIIDCNEREAEMMRMKRSDLIGSHIRNYLTEEYQKRFEDNFKEFKIKGNKIINIDLVRSDGKIITVERNVSALRNKDGSLRGIIVHSRDITEEIEAQNKIRLFSSAIEQSPTIFTLTDMEGKIIYVNKKFEEVTGYTKEEAIGSNPSILKSGMLPDNVYRDMWEKLINGGIWRGELCNKRKDGSLYWEYASMSAILDKSGKPTNMLKVAEDITSRKDTERELKEATVRYHNIFEMVPTPIVVHKGGRIIDFNKAAFEFTKEKSKEDMMGRPIMDYVHESSKELLKRRLRILENGKQYLPPVEENFVNAEGELRQVIAISREFNVKGERAFMVVFEDVTEKNRARKRLIESEKRFRSFFNLIPDPVTITDIESGTFLEVNDAALTIAQKTREEVIGKPVEQFGFYQSVNDRDNIVREIMTNGYIENVELLMKMGGKMKTILMSGRHLESEGENTMLMIARDITARKKMEEELIRMKERAEEGERLKASFLSNISHEIRTPMNAIMGFSDLLRDGSLDKKHRDQYINIIQQRGNDLLKMISNIMDISKIESGVLELENRPLQIGKVIRKAMDSARKRLLAEPEKEIDLTCNCGNNENLMVLGDEYRIRQVLENLLDNAIKFTQKGEVVLTLKREGNTLSLAVRDTGCGIPAEKQGIIFYRFVQLHDEADDNFGGAGLGLSISNSLLKMMGGDGINVQSEPGAGSVFSFSLNIHIREEQLERNMEKRDEKDINWSDKTILIAEDDPSNQLFVKVVLSKTKVNIMMANDGLEATQVYDQNAGKIDLVLVDVKMPKINGYELTQYLKSQDPKLPVIALTANAMNNDREEALKNGCDDYLAKPIAKEKLYRTIGRYFED
jgi:PAS domain S-box-containing protein